jgi:transposase
LALDFWPRGGRGAARAQGTRPGAEEGAGYFVIEDLLTPGVSDRPNWTPPRLAEEISRAWAKRGCDLRVEAPGQSKKRAMIGALDCAARKLIVNTSATKRSSDFIAFLGRLDAIYRPCPARQNKPVVLVLDNGPIHTSKASRAALSARDWLTVEWLAKYAPELNDIERSWRDLKGHFLAHQTFADADHLDRAIHKGIADMNEERQSPMCTNRRIAA